MEFPKKIGPKICMDVRQQLSNVPNSSHMINRGILKFKRAPKRENADFVDFHML